MKKLILALCLVLAVSGASYAGSVTATGMTQGDLYRALYNTQQAVMYGAMNNPGFTFCLTTSANLKTANSISFANNGNLYTFGASADIKASGTVTTQSVTTGYYLISLDNAGNASISGGTAAIPALVASKSPIGLVKVVKAASNTAGFKFFVTGLSSDTPSQTITYYNVRALNGGVNKVSLQNLSN